MYKRNSEFVGAMQFGKIEGGAGIVTEDAHGYSNSLPNDAVETRWIICPHGIAKIKSVAGQDIGLNRTP